MNFAVYDKQTGEILCHMTAPPDHVDLQCKEGQEFFLDCPHWATHIIDGKPVDLTPKPTLEQIKARKLDMIATKRWEAESGSITVDGLKVGTDSNSRSTIMFHMMNMADNIRWKGGNGKWKSLSKEDMAKIAKAVNDHVQWCFSREEELTSLVEQAKSQEDLDKIAW